MKRLLVFLLPLITLAFVSCDDDPEGTPMGRFVYYVSGDAGGVAEFRRFDIETGKDELLSSDRFTVLSDVASNGRLLFETRDGTDGYQLFGQCEGGQVIPVPLPVAGDPAQTYAYVHLEESGTPYPPAMSHGGHHAAFFVWQRPVAYRDSSAWKLHLCVFDCSAWKVRTLELGDVLRAFYAQQGMTPDDTPPVPDRVAISNDGGIAALTLRIQLRDGAGKTMQRNVVLGGTLDRMLVLPLDTLAQIYSISFEGATGTVYVATGLGEGTAFDCRGGSRAAPHAYVPSVARSFILSALTGEIVVPSYASTDHTFLLFRPFDGVRHDVPLSRETLLAAFPDTKWLLGSIEEEVALSPDGEWLAFRTSQFEQHRALYVVRRDGTGLRRIAEGVFDVPPVVSDLVPY